MNLAEQEIDQLGYDAAGFDNTHSNSDKEGGHIGVLIGLVMLICVVMAFVALATWSINDPSISNANGKPVSNWMGSAGASFSDLMIQFFGLGAALALFPPAIAGWLKVLREPLGCIKRRAISWFIMLILGAFALACLSVPQSWPLPSGLGGVVGDMALKIPAIFSGNAPSGWFAAILFFVFGLPTLALGLYASGLINRRGKINEDLISDEFEDDEASLAFGAFGHWMLTIKSKFKRNRTNTIQSEKKQSSGLAKVGAGLLAGTTTVAGFVYHKLTKPADDGLEGLVSGERNDPEFTEPAEMPEYGEQIYDAQSDTDLAAEFTTEFDQNSVPSINAVGSIEPTIEGAEAPRVKPMAPKPKPSARTTREAQTTLFRSGNFELPSLHFLGEHKSIVQDKTLSTDALEQNARLLEGVLSDFGVKGEIINVRPGPVVTLYELEPAPGIKSSRVIGLADDIARSMSAIAARVAVVPGRNAIGIELPNHRRETVYLREALASQAYETTKAKLPIVLGKDIGGEQIIADLSKMPHLLVAGTTGSGKSVAINTMILSILYRMTPDQVKMIMIDPKMLELSIYDGIPHLLTPVVTDPKKAVVALKWTVREMEERYKNMSKLGVRNIDGYNSRLAQAAKKNETISKTVQTGFDRETGEAIYETEELDLNPMPFIVVVIDEMADLMMVAGKDIEGTVQRLAQMARAAGIHVVMATQRPSVDVITGTIKANFPTRISFQVTSKIDSRTILGEQGAEQLLGMGDMLYMAGGGKITRVHGPFVEDEEVETVVNHLKSQGTPQYLESVTFDDEEETTGEGGSEAGGLSESTDIYDQAVAIVLKDRKVSTSYIQRRLSIGYNRAATLIERMEQESLISAANHAGKREILVPAEDEMM